MQDGRCSKKYPKQYISETQLGANSYQLYKRNSPDNGRQVSNISTRIGGSRVDQQIGQQMDCSIQQTAVAIHKLPLQRRTVHVHQIHQVRTEVCTQRMQSSNVSPMV